ncbi:MAG: alpha/beta hydrolase [Vibrio sp.]
MTIPADQIPQATQVFTLSDGQENQLQGNWPDRYYEQINRLELHYFKSPQPVRAQALVYGGGGYLQLVHDKEGVEVALWLNSLGIDAYVMTHRLPGAIKNEETGEVFPFDIALQDGLTSLEFLKSQSDLPLIHVGLSSGGHLSGVMACQTLSCKGKELIQAKGAIICYAPINANHAKYKAPAGKPDYPPVEKQNFYNAWPIGITAEPHAMPKIPLFVAYALHDQAVPVDHVLNLMKSAQETQSDVEAHIFSDAPHGFALRDKNGTHENWPLLAERWIDKVLK